MKKVLSLILSAVLLLAAAGCGAAAPAVTTVPAETEPSPTAPTPVDDPVLGLTIAPGEKMTLLADTLPAGSEVTWSSSDPERATVDANGNVQALQSRGQVTITAEAGDTRQSWEIALCERTPYGNVSLVSGNEKLSIGVWNGSHHIFDFEQMEQLQVAGIDLIIGVNEQWLDGTGMEGLLERAEMFGVSIIADLRTWDGETVPEYAENPYLKGFLMFDEPCATNFETLAELQDKFNMVMPEELMFYVNLFPEACSYESLFGDPYDHNCVDYEEYYLNKFTDMVDAACISYDSYPLQVGGYIRSGYYHNFDIAAKKAKELGVPFWYTLLSSGHNTTDGRYVTPTAQELRWQMALGLTYGAKNLTHYTYTTNEEGYEPMVAFDTLEPTAIFDDAKTVNLEFRAWEDIYMSYDWVGTAQVSGGKENALLEQLEYSIPFAEAGVLTGVESDQSLLVGVFQKDGSNAYMITNAGATSKCDLWMRLNFTMEDAQVTLHLQEGSYRCAAVIQGGKITYVPVNADNTVNISVRAYDGIFVIPVM